MGFLTDLPGGSWVKFSAVGDKVEGKLIGFLDTQDFNGNPCKGLVLEHADGTAVNVTVDKAAMGRALRAAASAAGVEDLALGGHLVLTHNELGVPKVAGHNPPKLFKAEWTPPTAAQAKAAASAATADLDDF